MNIQGLNQLRLHYDVYGLHLSANIEIPGLNAEKADKRAVDIEINIGYLPDDIQHLIDNPTAQYYLEPGYAEEDPPHLIINTLEDAKYYHFNYAYGVEFIIDQNATKVWCIWREPLVLEDAALFLLGPAIGFMLRLRSITCLHASGVVINQQSFALTGPSGAGKSTLAASFAAAGYPVLTDDILPLTIKNDVIVTHSGYSRLRLFPNSFENLQELPDNLPLLAPGWDKCYLDLASDSYELYKSPSELKVVYVIDWGTDKPDSPSIETITGASALPILAANTYRNELLSPIMRSKEFVFLSQLVSRIKVKKLHPVNDISAIAQLRDMLLEDFHKETNQPSRSQLNINKGITQ